MAGARAKKLERIVRCVEEVALSIRAEADLLDHIAASAKRVSKADSVALGRLSERLRCLAALLTCEAAAESVSTIRTAVKMVGAMMVGAATLTSTFTDVSAHLNRDAQPDVVVKVAEIERLCGGWQRDRNAEVHTALKALRGSLTAYPFRNGPAFDLAAALRKEVHLSVDGDLGEDAVTAAIEIYLSEVYADQQPDAIVDDPVTGKRTVVQSKAYTEPRGRWGEA